MMSDGAQEIQQDSEVHSKDAVSRKNTRLYDLMMNKFSGIIDRLSAKKAAAELSRKLFEAKMITRDMMDRAHILHGLIESEKVYPLVSAILDMVKTNEESYKKFIKILRDTDGLCDVAEFIEEYSVSKDVCLPECVSGRIKRYLPKCERQRKVFVCYKEKERKLVICAGSEEECSEVKDWIEQKIFPSVLEFQPVCTRFLQTTCTSIKLKRTAQRAPREFAWFKSENLGIHPAAGGVEMNKDRPCILKGKVYAEDYISIYKNMTGLLEKLEPYQHSLKVGYEARFGRVHWKFPLQQTDADICTLVRADKTFFDTRVSGNIQELLEFTTPTPTPSTVKLLDPLKVMVTTDDGTQYEVVAVVDEHDVEDGRFTLNRVYYAQPGGRLTCDIVFPNKKYDIRIAPNYAPAIEEDVDHEVLKTIRDMMKKTTTTRTSGIKMPVRGKNYYVKFMRRKTQIQHIWKERPEWILAEYHVQEFAVHERDVEKLKIGDVQEIKFHEEKTEIELWSQKWFPDSTEESRFTKRHYHNLKSTANVSLPSGDEIEASSWTAKSFMESFEDFVRTSVDIVDILSH